MVLHEDDSHGCSALNAADAFLAMPLENGALFIDSAAEGLNDNARAAPISFGTWGYDILAAHAPAAAPFKCIITLGPIDAG